MVFEEQVSFQVGGLSIEGALAYDEAISTGSGLVLCSPHPQLGGDMDNNVIRSLYYAAAGQKFISLRFNYRGVGNSDGQRDSTAEKEDLKAFWENSWSPVDVQRLQDASGGLDFLRGVPGVRRDCIFLMGYSFGAYVAQSAAIQNPSIKGIILVAPTVHFHDYSPLNSLKVPKLVVTSDNDFSYAMEELQSVYSNFAPPKSLKVFSGADHFFIGHEQALSSCITEFMVNLCGKKAPGA